MEAVDYRLTFLYLVWWDPGDIYTCTVCWKMLKSGSDPCSRTERS